MNLAQRLLGLFALTAALLGCTGGPPPATLTVLAGSELKDLQPFFDEIRRETGVTLDMRYIGTLDGAEKLMAGEAVDLAWFSHGKYISLLQGNRGRIAAQEKIMLSPVVMGIKESKARAWGWIDNPNVTWRDIAAKAAGGELRYAMTNPASSNSGFTALLGVTAAFAGSADALEAGDVDSDELKAFFKGQALTAGSSGWLADSYVREQDRLDGMVNYESVLMALNDSGQLNERLYLIYPREGIITADYPLMLLDGTKREAYDRLVAYLRSPDFQRTLMERTLRRPVTPQVKPGPQFPDRLLVELPFPNSREVIDRILFAYLDEQRVPPHAIFVLDVSGSMNGRGLHDLKTSLANLTGLDTSLTGQFARFRGRERVTLITFSNVVRDIDNFEIDNPDSQSSAMQAIRNRLNSLQAGGGTAMFSALQQAYELAAEAQAQDPQRYYSIVLMSDGINNNGINLNQFRNYYRLLPQETRNIKTFTILFGDADEKSMEALAQETGGRMFDGRTHSLNLVFKQIRGYQ